MSDAKASQPSDAQGLPPAPHSITLHEIAQLLKSDPEQGLSDAQAAEHRQRFGANELAEAPRTPLWVRLARQFNQLVIWILIAAAIVSGFLGDTVETVAILAIVLLNGLIGFFQEERAEQALAALRKMSSPQAKVTRGGKTQSLPATQIVPGDRIELEAGDYVPADARLIEAFSLRVQEASLTGESTPVEKDAHAELEAATSLGDRENMVYMGTVVSAGKASGLVVGTGMQTELGHIAGLLQRQEAEQTPLQRRLEELGRVLVYLCLVLVAAVFGLQMLRGGELLEVFLVSVSLAVAAVPEGLPAVVTLALALGLQRMAKRNALVRKLPSVETLGSVTVICTDKTGTLTRNEMTVRTLVTSDNEYEVTGTGYAPQGEFRQGDKALDKPLERPDLRLLLTAGARCNDAKLTQKENEDAWKIVGDPTEGALLVAARKAQLDIESDGHKLVSELPFDSQRKAMSVLIRERDGGMAVYTKGAPEVILRLCQRELRGGRDEPLTDKPLNDERRRAIEQQNVALAERALRVLALAYRPQPAEHGEEIREEDLVFIGLAGMIDPPREEARQAIAACHSAGIRPVMITGDHPSTAKAIAGELGLLAGGAEVLPGQALEELSDQQLKDRVEKVGVYARVTAEHKLRVIKAWQARGQVVAMTGDGVNDAPAVKAADIGIAMGITGTDVTKEASDLVLTDDNFKSIVSAVEEGRSIFDNIQNFVHYLLSCNAGEVLLMFFAALVGWPVPLAAIQILWINLVTDGLPALALALEPPDREIMRRPPRPPREPVLTKRRAALILLHGVLIAAAAAIGFWITYRGKTDQIDLAQTTAFCIMAFSQLVFSFACRSDKLTLPQLGLLTNPYLLAAIAVSGLLQVGVVMLPFARPVFDVGQSPDAYGWLLIAGLSLAPVTIVEVAKLVLAAMRKPK